MPTVKEIIQEFRQELSEICSPHESFHYAWLIFDHLRGWTKTNMMLHDNTKLTLSEQTFIENALQRLKNHEPIQYVIGNTEFFGLHFHVNQSVLVPRPETEELVEWILKSVNGPQKTNILDIGTGSGCIAIALAGKLANAQISAWDISAEALKTAAHNASINKVNINFEQKNILEAIPENKEEYDIIVSNPPYVRESEKELIKANVLNFEPFEALFVKDDDPLLFYRTIAAYAIEALKKNGMLFFEINRDFGNETKKLLQEKGFTNIELKRDLSGNFRMIKAVKPVG